MVTDPYQTLHVTRNTPDDEVRSSYRKLARQYEEDSMQNIEGVPPLETRIAELNEAYDAIMLERRQAQSGPTVSYQAGSTNQNPGNNRLTDIRTLIQSNRLLEADELLNGIPTARRDGEWHFLKGTVQYNQGRLEDAAANYTKAVQMDPNNQEYAAVYNQMMWQRQTGRPGNQYDKANPVGGCSMCDMCLSVYCASTCCNCFGPRCY